MSADKQDELCINCDNKIKPKEPICESEVKVKVFFCKDCLDCDSISKSPLNLLYKKLEEKVESRVLNEVLEIINRHINWQKSKHCENTKNEKQAVIDDLNDLKIQLEKRLEEKGK